MVRTIVVGLALAGCTGGGTQQITNIYVEAGTGFEVAKHDGDTDLGPSVLFVLGFGSDDGEGLEWTNGVGPVAMTDGGKFERGMGMGGILPRWDVPLSHDGGRAWRWTTIGAIGVVFDSTRANAMQSGSARFGLGAYTGPSWSLHADNGLNLRLSAGPHVAWGIHDIVFGGPQVRLRLGHDEHRR